MIKHVLCFGDSNTWGYNAEDGSRFDEDTRWTCLLQKLLGEEYQVMEEGLCGRTAVFEDPLGEGLNGYTYLTPCMNTHSPIDYMIVMLGTNDCKERFHATSKNIADGMKRLLTKALQTPAWRGEKKLLLVCPAPIGRECEQSVMAGEMGISAEKSEKLAQYYELAAKELGIDFWDSAEVVEMNHIDYMHLDVESHKRFAEKIYSIIRNWE